MGYSKGIAKIIFIMAAVIVLLIYFNQSVNACSTDMDCAMNGVCVKAPFELRGICVKQVDKYGTPKPDQKRNYDPFEGMCSYNSDCPIGFFCSSKHKVCIKRR